MTQEMRKDHLVNQPTQFWILGRYVRDDSLGRVIRRFEHEKLLNTNIDLASLCENKYPVFPSFDILSANFGTKTRSLCVFAYRVF